MESRPAKAASILVALLVILATAAPLPLVATAQDEGQASGSFSVQNVEPKVTEITLKDENDQNTVTELTPTNTYNLHITISDQNGYDTITEVVVYIYYAASTTDPPGSSFNTQELAIFRWDSTNGWKLVSSDSSWDEPTGTTWSVDPRSTPAAGSGPQGSGSDANFLLVFRVGKVAKEADVSTGFWIIAVKAKDDQGAWSSLTKDGEESGGSVTQYRMNWYGEIGLSTTSFSFGTVNMQSTDNPIQTPGNPINVYVVANGNYNIQVKTDSQWTGQNDASHTVNVITDDPRSTDKAIRIKLGSTDDPANPDLSIPPNTYTDWKTGQTGPTTDGNAADGDGASHAAYMWLDVGVNIPADTYGGNVYFKVMNG